MPSVPEYSHAQVDEEEDDSDNPDELRPCEKKTSADSYLNEYEDDGEFDEEDEMSSLNEMEPPKGSSTQRNNNERLQMRIINNKNSEILYDRNRRYYDEDVDENIIDEFHNDQEPYIEEDFGISKDPNNDSGESSGIASNSHSDQTLPSPVIIKKSLVDKNKKKCLTKRGTNLIY
jgi:hypothetical protein